MQGGGDCLILRGRGGRAAAYRASKWYRGLPRLFFPYSMAAAGQRQMQAMQWVQPGPHTGLPSRRVMLPVGHSRAHWPQPVQASPAVKARDFTKRA